MGKRFMRWARLVAMCARNVPFGKVVSLERGHAVNCAKCSAAGVGLQRTRIGRQGIWTGDAQAPDGWGIRYERHNDGEPTPNYYCGDCRAAIAAGKMKV